MPLTRRGCFSRTLCSERPLLCAAFSAQCVLSLRAERAGSNGQHNPLRHHPDRSRSGRVVHRPPVGARRRGLVLGCRSRQRRSLARDRVRDARATRQAARARSRSLDGEGRCRDRVPVWRRIEPARDEPPPTRGHADRTRYRTNGCRGSAPATATRARGFRVAVPTVRDAGRAFGTDRDRSEPAGWRAYGLHQPVAASACCDSSRRRSLSQRVSPQHQSRRLRNVTHPSRLRPIALARDRSAD